MFWRLISVLAAGALLLAGCTAQLELDVEQESAAIEEVLDNYVKSVEDEDLDFYGENVAHNPHMVNFGAFGEPIRGWQELEQVIEDQNEALDDIKIEVSDLDIHVPPYGTIAWATSLWTLTAEAGEDAMELAVRCTWVLEKKNDAWVIVHFHKSIAAG